MSEVHVYSVRKMVSEAGNTITYTGGGPDIVMKSAYDEAIGREVALQAQLDEARQLLHTASIRLALWLAPSDDPRKQIIAFLSGDEPPASVEKVQVEKPCPVCDGGGTISTGIDEAPSTNCKKCDGTGKGGEQ